MPPPPDHRPAVTRSIWRYAFGMLVLCIPLAPLADSPWLPYGVLGAAALGTLGVWMFGRPARLPKPERDPEVLELEKVVANLSERLESVEVLNRFEERLARESVERPEGARRGMGPSRELEPE